MFVRSSEERSIFFATYKSCGHTGLRWIISSFLLPFTPRAEIYLRMMLFARASIYSKPTSWTVLRHGYRNLTTSTVGGKKQELVSTNHTVEGRVPPFVDSIQQAKATRPKFDIRQAAQKLPPDHPAKIRELKTFDLPDSVTGSPADCE